MDRTWRLSFHRPRDAGHSPHRQRYHALPLEHANRNLIFNYKIASVCGILIRNRKPQACPKSMTAPVRHSSSEPRMPGAPRAADDDRKQRNNSGGPSTAVITKPKTQVKKPSLYRVLLLNDDYT